MRKGGVWETLLENIDLLIKAKGDNPYPAIDLQLVAIDGHECDPEGVQRIADERGWDVRVRHLQDCFPELNNPDKFRVENNELCLNPWTSVSIHKNGNVVPCCRVWSDEWVYGNLNDNTLEEIWNGESVEEFRKLHRDGTNLPFFCRSCFSRSPSYLHLNLYQNAVNDMIRKGAGDRVLQVQAKSNKNTG
jgi:radical SAM protein with 4Fe4S-binding SPASM domain